MSLRYGYRRRFGNTVYKFDMNSIYTHSLHFYWLLAFFESLNSHFIYIISKGLPIKLFHRSVKLIPIVERNDFPVNIFKQRIFWNINCKGVFIVRCVIFNRLQMACSRLPTPGEWVIKTGRLEYLYSARIVLIFILCRCVVVTTIKTDD